jgi:hypothetical protein
MVKSKLKKSNKVLVKKVGIGVLVILLIGTILFALEKTGVTNFYTNSEETNENAGTPYADIKDVEITGDSDQSGDASNPKENSSTNISDKTSNDFQVNTSGSISITTLDQTNGIVSAQATVSNFSPQQCVYTFTIQDGKPVIRETNNECTRVSIPQGEFDRIGLYKLTVTAYSGSEKLTTSKDIDIK